MNKRPYPVALVLLILQVACTDSAATAKELAGAIVHAEASALRTQPSLEFALTAFDGKVAAVEIWFDAAPGTTDSSLTLTSVTLDGRSPVETVPLRLGPVAEGKRASAQLHFEGPKWRARWNGVDGSPTQYETVFAYAAETEHTSNNASTHSKCSASMPLWVRADSPLHGQMMRSFGDDHGR